MTNPYQSWSDAGALKLTTTIERKASALSLARRFAADPDSIELRSMASGMVGAAVTILSALHRTGVRFGGAAAWLNDDHDFCFVHFNREFNASPERRRYLLETVGRAIDTCVQRGYISASYPPPRREVVPAPAPEPEKTPQVLKVEIVGMPDRLTTTEIARDKDGNISSSAQLERDVA